MNIKTSYILRICLIIYCVTGIAWSVAYIWPVISNMDIRLDVFSAPDMLLVFYFLIPVWVAILALVGLLLKKVILGALWGCTLFWLFLAVGELLEGSGIQPAVLPVVFVCVFSSLVFIYLILFHIFKMR
ncbi:MAG: hypothetical protein GY799_14580 [Desulfobulbaceae bacterium]|nr:hypothetical protein [Desulfobulbaceae bacterium]